MTMNCCSVEMSKEMKACVHLFGSHLKAPVGLGKKKKETEEENKRRECIRKKEYEKSEG